MHRPFAFVAFAAAIIGLTTIASAQESRGRLLSARNAAFDANFRNDAAGLRDALTAMERLTTDPDVGAFALYYASWTEWSLTASHMAADQMDAAQLTATAALAHARRAAAARPDSAEFAAMLVNALITVAVTDRMQFQPLLKDIAQARQRALTLGPRSPRVVMMDAGMVFNMPPEAGGDQDKGLARWEEALRLFDAEARADAAADSLEPAWGRELAYGWAANLYLSTKPPRIDRARAAAEQALSLRPDFWFVKERILPRLKDAP